MVLRHSGRVGRCQLYKPVFFGARAFFYCFWQYPLINFVSFKTNSMLQAISKIYKYNLFYFVMIGFVLVLPFSQALVSIFSGILLFIALVEDSWTNKKLRLKQHKYVLLIPSIFLVYILSSIFTFNSGAALYDLKKNLFFLVIPLAFILGKPINDKEKRVVFYAFALAVFVSVMIAFMKWLFLPDTTNFGVHSVSYISHIRFSFQLLLVFWFLLILLVKSKDYFSAKEKALICGLAIYFIAFLLFQQSLTGMIALGTSMLFYSSYLLFHIGKKYRVILLVIVLLVLIAPMIYVVSVVNSFYQFEKVDSATIEKVTVRGNAYSHNFEDKMVENGKYVNLYVCQDEMRAEWNKVSELKYDSIGKNGFPIHSTLIRYLTSKGLRKDAEGVLALSAQDIENVENGVANVIFQEKRFSLYPRIYLTVWEYYVYSETGNANYQSFSQRIEFSKAAITIIKKNFWTGVGTGNWRDEFKNAYHENNSKLNEKLYASSHNQYLNYWVKFGVIGLCFILFALVYPVIKSKRYRDPLFLVFLVFLAFANFSDSNFESHMGSSFFLFFYCLFLIAGSTNYLELKHDGQLMENTVPK